MRALRLAEERFPAFEESFRKAYRWRFRLAMNTFGSTIRARKRMFENNNLPLNG
jgi:hypothetical protein